MTWLIICEWTSAEKFGHAGIYRMKAFHITGSCSCLQIAFLQTALTHTAGWKEVWIRDGESNPLLAASLVLIPVDLHKTGLDHRPSQSFYWRVSTVSSVSRISLSFCQFALRYHERDRSALRRFLSSVCRVICICWPHAEYQFYNNHPHPVTKMNGFYTFSHEDREIKARLGRNFYPPKLD
jgi:hypothetical protein